MRVLMDNASQIVSTISTNNQMSKNGTAAFSMSESLAVGLVNRMVNDYAFHYKNYLSTTAKAVRRENVTTVPKKRCVAYRFLSRRTTLAIPNNQQVIIHTQGKQDGTSKSAKMSVIHWHAAEDSRRLTLLVTYLAPGWVLAKRWVLFEMSKHALQRLFYRLKCLEPAPILQEIKPAIDIIAKWYGFIIRLIYSSHDALSIGIPSTQGVLYFKKSYETTPHSPASLIASTWVSDTRMQDRPEKLDIVNKARSEGGIVIEFQYNLINISPYHNVDELLNSLETYTSPLFDEMLTFLPK